MTFDKRLEDIDVDFVVRFPEEADGQKMTDRVYCTVGRMVEAGPSQLVWVSSISRVSV